MLLSRSSSSGLGQASRHVDIVELRTDGIDGVTVDDLERLRDAVTVPSILTCRSAKEGGAYRGTEPERLRLLEAACSLGFDYVDVEIASLDEGFPKQKTKLIASHHDFEGMPNEPERWIERALELDADIVKVAARVGSLADTLTLSKLGERVHAAGKEFAPVPLGPSGVSGRILANAVGADFMYLAARAGQPMGPGQVDVDTMHDVYRFESIDADTAVFGILGSHALDSRSPRMHNPLFARLERNAVYVPFHEAELDRFVSAARALPISGLSVTHPFKEQILDHVDETDGTAKNIGAVNTVVVEDGRWIGYNTDFEGVLTPLARFEPWEGRKAVVLGAGGAARAAVFALSGAGAHVEVRARRREQAERLTSELGGVAASWDGALDAPALLINATPAGALDGQLPAFDASAVVFDMVPAPEETRLIQRAREQGAETITGIEMLAAQAVRQAELWTGTTPDVQTMAADARRDDRMTRYSRQILFSEIGPSGQERIRAANVLVVGLGALGSVASEMVARAGVHTLRIVDRDYVDETNLQRQSLYDEDDWRAGLPKAVAAARKLTRINRDVRVDAHVSDVHAGNVLPLIEGMDLILDGTDNFETRYLLNDASMRTGVPWIYAACVGSYGMSFVVRPGKSPCLRCVIEDEPAPGTSPTCDTAGVIAPIVHAVAAYQTTEALKLLAGREDALLGDILSLDIWRGRVDRFHPAAPRKECPACGRREWDYLDGDRGSRAVALCGRNAVQVRPTSPGTVELQALAAKLSELGVVTVNPYLLRLVVDSRELVVFKDGRAIVHGTEDPTEARSLYARYVGS